MFWVHSIEFSRLWTCSESQSTPSLGTLSLHICKGSCAWMLWWFMMTWYAWAPRATFWRNFSPTQARECDVRRIVLLIWGELAARNFTPQKSCTHATVHENQNLELGGRMIQSPGVVIQMWCVVEIFGTEPLLDKISRPSLAPSSSSLFNANFAHESPILFPQGPCHIKNATVILFHNGRWQKNTTAAKHYGRVSETPCFLGEIHRRSPQIVN